MAIDEAMRRVQAIDAYEAITSLDKHGEMVRLILIEVSLLAETYRNVRRHDIPHIRELAGLLDVLWQEIEMVASIPEPLLPPVAEDPEPKAFKQLAQRP